MVETIFGVMFADADLTVDEKIILLKKLDAGCVRLTVELSSYEGKEIYYLERLKGTGIQVLLNLNWQYVTVRWDGEKIANRFIGEPNMQVYKDSIKKVLDKYKPEVAVIENEPLTKIFYETETIDNYINYMLPTAIEICHSYGVKVADGSVSATFVDNLQNPNLRFTSQKMRDTKKLITAYAGMPLDYVNVHTKVTDPVYPENQLKRVADYLRTQTGKPVMSNEFHLEVDADSACTSIVDELRNGEYSYGIYYTGGGENIRLNRNTELTGIGRKYQSLI